MRRALVVSVLLVPMLLGVSYAPFRLVTGSGGSSTLFDSPSININTSYDPLCNPATFSSAGGLFCDGFEDGSLGSPTSFNTSTDGWFIASSGGPLGACDPLGGAGCNDPKGTNWTNCNSNVTDTGKADFGAAGTPCTATNGVSKSIEPSHCLKVDGSSDQVECSTNHALDVQDLRVRFYIKFSGVSSTRCAGGYPNCSAFAVNAGGNGLKGIEYRDGLDTGGISYLNWSLEGQSSTSWTFGTIEDGGCMAGVGGVNTGKTCENGGYCYPHLASFNWTSFKDHWIFVEQHIKQTATNDASVLEMWMNDCGLDGLGCTGTPTQLISSSSLDLFMTSPCSLPDAFYYNFDHGTGITGEVQIDEIVVMDGTVKTSPIGFAPIRVP